MIFKDKKGREWNVDLNIGVAMDLKKAGINLYELEENKAEKFRELLDKKNEFDLLAFIFKIIKPQADAAGISERDFYEGLAGIAIVDARIAFQESYANFTQSPAIHSMIQESLAMHRRAEKAMERAANQVIQLARQQYAAHESEISESAIGKLFESELSKRQEGNPNRTQLQQTA